MSFFNEIKDRKVRKYLAIYISACITTLGLVHLFSFRYHLPSYIFDTLLVLLIFGLVNIFLFAWYHVKEGKQKVKIREYFLHSGILIIAIVAAYLFAHRGPFQLLPLNAKTVAVLPADMYAILGDKKRLLDWLNRAVEKGWTEYRQNLVYPYLDSVKSELQFQNLISEMKIRIDSMKAILQKENSTWEECN